MHYWSHYFSNRRFPWDQEFYVVYTNFDHSIPFQSSPTLAYWLVNLRFIPTSIRVGSASGESFKAFMHAYVDIAREGCAAFREVPTIMPHFAEPHGQGIHVTRTLLKPINCSPSLHTAAPFFAYNISAKYFPEKEPELRRLVADVVSTIIKTKFHAMIDVAFGLFLAQKVIEDRVGLNFNALESFFTREQKIRDNIPYEHIYRMYHEINDLGKTLKGEESRLPKIMKRYFEETGLPRVRRERSCCLYDLERKTLVYLPELKVGKGLL